MTIKNTVLSVEDHLKASWAAVREQGGELPEQLNMANLAAGVESVSGGSSTPTVRTFAGLQEAMRDGTAKSIYPVGVLIPDTYNGESNPLVVAHYYDGSSGKYGSTPGVFLFRQFATDRQVYGGTSYYYSGVKKFLEGEYLENCSAELKAAISEVDVPCLNRVIRTKVFLMSDIEVCSYLSSANKYRDGEMWDFWKQQTGWSEPHDTGSNVGRIRGGRISSTTTSRTIVDWWLRSQSSGNTTNIGCIADSGSIQSYTYTSTYYLMPAFFIAQP